MRKQLELIIRENLQIDLYFELNLALEENQKRIIRNNSLIFQAARQIKFYTKKEIKQTHDFFTDKCDPATLENLERMASSFTGIKEKCRKLEIDRFILEIERYQLEQIDKDKRRAIGELRNTEGFSFLTISKKRSWANLILSMNAHKALLLQ